MQASISKLQQENLTLRRTQLQQQQELAPPAKTTTIELDDVVQAAIAPHLQLKPLEAHERSKIMGSYPRPEPPLPKTLRDDNGLASKAIKDAANRKLVITHLPGFQKDHLDVARIAATAWQGAMQLQDGAAKLDLLHKAIKDVLTISIDNAQKLAATQLKTTLEGAGTKGAYSLLDLGPNTDQLDFSDDNILQLAHVEAITDLCKFNNDIDKAMRTSHGGRGNGGRGRGGRGFGGGRGGGRGRGRGRSSKNWKGYQQNNWRDRQDNDSKEKKD